MDAEVKKKMYSFLLDVSNHDKPCNVMDTKVSLPAIGAKLMSVGSFKEGEQILGIICVEKVHCAQVLKTLPNMRCGTKLFNKSGK